MNESAWEHLLTVLFCLSLGYTLGFAAGWYYHKLRQERLERREKRK